LLRIPPADGRIVFVDTEFTTLDKRRREVWELAVILRDPGLPDVEVEWQIRPDLKHASPDALRVGRYYRRCRVQDRAAGIGVLVVGPGVDELLPDQDIDRDRVGLAGEIASTAAAMLDGAYLVAAVPSADELALDRFLPRYGQVLSCHYRLSCVENLARGYLQGKRAVLAGIPDRVGELAELTAQIPPPPWNTKVLSKLCGVDPLPPEKAHRALNDARWVRDMWDAIHGTVAL
jgi:hypothetical protein